MVDAQNYEIPNYTDQEVQEYQDDLMLERLDKMRWREFRTVRTYWQENIQSLLSKIRHLNKCYLYTCPRVEFVQFRMADANTVMISTNHSTNYKL